LFCLGAFSIGGRTEIGAKVGDRIVRLRECRFPEPLGSAVEASTLNRLASLGQEQWAQLYARIPELALSGPCVTPQQVEMRMPFEIGDYTDFYASIHHAERVGRKFRPDNPLLPNYKHVPIAYHGRASSIVLSGTPVKRPWGQVLPQGADSPVFQASAKLDFELELGCFVGPGNRLGEPIAVERAHEHIFGFVLVNDWSARDIQAWEYQPLGPFLGKNFATSISRWVLPAAVLIDRKVPWPEREVLDYLRAPGDWVLDLPLEVKRNGETITRSNAHHLYWTFAQMVAHHTSNGCNLRPGDLLASGTISGPDEGGEGCLLEKGLDFLKDGEEVALECPALPDLRCEGRVEP
jgi:fumarylacetoacetase